jgi:HlyD family secretion protein
MRLKRRQGALLLGVLVVGGGLGWMLLRPTAYEVEVATVERGPLRVTVDDDGVTKIQRHVEITAPVTGRLAESRVLVGDTVIRGMVVARVSPAPLDPRSREQALASLEAARALRSEAKARIQQASVLLGEARRARSRTEALAHAGALTAKDLEQAVAEEKVRERDLEAATSRERAAAQEERRVRALLAQADPSEPDSRGPVAIRAPIGGRVLRILEEHDRVVPAGTSLMEIGDPSDLEVVADVLTRDVGQISSGAPMLVRVAPGRELKARVKRVEPAAFTKVSPLGVEEQRVNVVGEFLDSPTGLGDRFEVDVSIVLWESERALKVPGGALFPVDSGWAAFTMTGGRARLRSVTLGHRGARETEVLSGLGQGDTVIVHPDDRMRDGIRVAPRD